MTDPRLAPRPTDPTDAHGRRVLVAAIEAKRRWLGGVDGSDDRWEAAFFAGVRWAEERRMEDGCTST